jgi:hypothetical protein
MPRNLTCLSVEDKQVLQEMKDVCKQCGVVDEMLLMLLVPLDIAKEHGVRGTMLMSAMLEPLRKSTRPALSATGAIEQWVANMLVQMVDYNITASQDILSTNIEDTKQGFMPSLRLRVPPDTHRIGFLQLPVNLAPASDIDTRLELVAGGLVDTMVMVGLLSPSDTIGFTVAEHVESEYNPTDQASKSVKCAVVVHVVGTYEQHFRAHETITSFINRENQDKRPRKKGCKTWNLRRALSGVTQEYMGLNTFCVHDYFNVRMMHSTDYVIMKGIASSGIVRYVNA